MATPPSVSLPDTILGGHIKGFITLKRRSWRPKTLQNYTNILSRFADYIGPAWPVTAGQVMGWIDSTAGGEVTVRTYYTHLRAFFNFLEQLEIIEANRNPTRQIAQLRLLPPRPHLPPVALSRAEVERLLAQLRRAAAAGEGRELRDLALVHFALVTGCRAGEVAALRWEQLRLAELAAEVAAETAKTRRGRVVYFNLAVKGDLWAWQRYLAEGGHRPAHVFPAWRWGRPGPGLTASGVSQLFKRRARAAGLPRAYFHALRHTSALLALEAGVSLDKVRDQLGHADIATTSVYLRGRDEARARAYRGLTTDDGR